MAGEQTVKATQEPAPTEVAGNVVAAPEFIRLPLGSVLTEQQALELAAERPVKIVVLAGAVDCGKTTLLASLYELFQSGPVDFVQFAGCNTLPAFEQRCHLSRIESEKQSSDTARTPYQGPNPEYLHLRVRAESVSTEFVDLLVTDVSGEMFEHARNSTDECRQLTFLKRAGHFVVFLDCEKALNAARKWDMVQEVKSLLQSCLDSEMLPEACSCTVVWAKLDFFEAAPNKDVIAEFVREVEADLRGTFGLRIPSLKFHKTAARPTHSPAMKMGFGIKELLTDWVAVGPQERIMRIEPMLDAPGLRESEKFFQRHFTKADTR